jgi:tryptophanyl-tRNA synthetase
MSHQLTQPADVAQSINIDRKRVLTGMRTTGKLHLGHYVGALEDWKSIQDEGKFTTFYLLADLQALTTHADNPALLTESVKDVVLDWLSVGLDPSLDRVHFVLQSQIPERFVLASIFMMITKHAEVMRNPTLKTELESRLNATMGFMAYPVDQMADIAMVSPTPPQKGDQLLVPTGEDQAPLTELAREVMRRFNKQYGPVFVEPEGQIGKIGRLVGPDGQEKMGKSLGNAINLSDDAKTVTEKVSRMYTDPKRLKATDPGETEKNPVFAYLRAFDRNKDEVAELTERYHHGKVGDVEVKKILSRTLNEFLDPIRERRAQFANADVRGILVEGTNVTRAACQPVLELLREKLHLKFPV